MHLRKSYSYYKVEVFYSILLSVVTEQQIIEIQRGKYQLKHYDASLQNTNTSTTCFSSIESLNV